MTETVHVAVDLNGRTTPAGLLHVDTRRTTSSTFTYDPCYLVTAGAYPLDPALPLLGGAPHVRGLPGAFSDAAPDRWGRNLIRRRFLIDAAPAGRQPGDVDYLLGVSDHSRQGALRFARSPAGPYLADQGGPPPLIQMPRLLRAADRVARSTATDDDLHTLLDAGSGSLGGARPKASVTDADTLYIAKFPHHQDSWDVMAWEATVLDLARDAGVHVSNPRLVRLAEGAVLLVERFDRDGGTRIGYLSALSLLGAHDGDSLDYLDIAEAMALAGGDPTADLRQLWTRIAFSIAVNNTDDHLRNRGFLHTPTGWRLSPAFDINPNPQQVARQTSIAGQTTRAASAHALLTHADRFGLDPHDTASILDRLRAAVSHWPTVAATNGIGWSEQAIMTDAFNIAVFPG